MFQSLGKIKKFRTLGYNFNFRLLGEKVSKTVFFLQRSNMTIQLFVSRTCCNMVMRSQQDHIKRILEQKSIEFEEVDISDPHRKEEKQFMQTTLKLSDEDLVALPPQLFKKKDYRGDYDGFFKAVECESLYKYLDLQVPQTEVEFQITKHED